MPDSPMTEPIVLAPPSKPKAEKRADDTAIRCPVCGCAAEPISCKVVCRSATCTYRIIYNCSEF